MTTKDAIKSRLITDNRAVSPVIGVILMVAITVILAAVIGTFVLDIGQDAGQRAPQASLTASISTQDGNVTIDHQGGDALQATETRLIIEDSSGTQVVYDPGANSATFGVGDSAEFSNATSTPAPSSFPLANASGTVTVTSGNQYTVTLIDTNSQRVIFETTLTA